jgi:hypothetical protein
MENKAMRADPADTIKRPRRRARSAAQRLHEAVLALAGNHAVLVRHGERGWASITFSGTRHEMELRFEGGEAIAAGEIFIAALPDHEFTLPRQLVADAAVTAADHRLLPEPSLTVRVELLLLDEG